MTPLLTPNGPNSPQRQAGVGLPLHAKSLHGGSFILSWSK